MFVEKMRSLWSSERADGGGEQARDDGAEPSASTPDSKLFNCPQCDVVYLASEKDVCSSCRGEVREVPMTFTQK